MIKVTATESDKRDSSPLGTTKRAVSDMISQADISACASPVLGQGWERSAGLTLFLSSTLAGMFLLMAVASSQLLLTPYVDLFLVLGLLSALAVIDQATKAFPLNMSRLAPGLVMSTIAVSMLFHQ